MEKENEVKNVAAQTYTGDMAEVLENDTEGLVKKIIQEAEGEEREKKNLSPQSKKNKFFMLIGILLIVLSLAVLSFVFLNKNPNANTVPIEKQFVPLIFNDQSSYLEVSGLDKDEIIQTVLNEVNNTKAPNGGVEGIYLTENKQIVGLRQFLSLVKSNFVPGDNTLFVSDNFLLGAVNGDTPPAGEANKDFFILLKVRSAADIFNSLRAWENNLLSDLHGFLGINISSDTNYLFTKSFADGIVENKNARILYDKNGQVVLVYIFADDNSVVITDSLSAVHEIMLRLASK